MEPAVAALADGGFVVAWNTVQYGATSMSSRVTAQRFAATGAVVGAALATRHGWKVGDTIPLQATIFPQKDGSNAWPLQLSGSGEWAAGRLRFRGQASAAPGFEAVLGNLLNIIGRRQGAVSLISIG
jgi:hypothetical protein